MNDLDGLLASACLCYRELLKLYMELDASGLAGEGMVLERLVEQTEPKLAAAREADLALLDSLNDVGSSPHHLPMLLEYRELLARVAECNQVLLGHARTHRALVSAELSDLRAGKNAMAGYRLPAEKSGSTLSEAY